MEFYIEILAQNSIIWFIIVFIYAIRMFTTYRRETIDILLFRDDNRNMSILTWFFLSIGVLSLIFYIVFS